MTDENDTPASKLDEFLKQWDGQKPNDGNKELLAKVAKQEEQIKDLLQKSDVHDKALEADAYKDEIKPVIATVAGETKASARTVHGWLNEEADENPKLRTAWNDREEHPEAFDKMIEELKPKFKEYIEREAKSVLDIKDDDTKEDKDNDTTDDTKADPKGDKDLLALSHAFRIARGANAPASDNYEDVQWSGLSDNAFAQMSEKVFADMRSGKLQPEPKS